jgi:hypothetical protein
VHPHLTTSEEIGHGGDGFLGVFGAGANGEDEVTEGKFGILLEDLSVLFHLAVKVVHPLEAG